jgi:CRP/FNR family cyclic AMP-dependent transcriptional regulator
MHSALTSSALRTQRLLKHADEGVFALTDQHVRYQNLAVGDIVAYQGEPNSPLIFVLSGQLHASQVSDAGHETSLISTAAGESCGESAIVLGVPSVASFTALTSTRVGVMSRVHARKLFSEPSVAGALLEILSRKIQRTGQGQSRLSIPRAYSRVYAILNEAVAHAAEDEWQSIVLANQAAIAIAANVSRETVSRAIKPLLQRGAIAKKGRGFQVRDRSILAAIVAGDVLQSFDGT